MMRGIILPYWKRDANSSKQYGAIGIGAMIVFIAMVLVAGIAATVIIQTSNTLEMQALSSGQETISEVSTGIMVETIEGYNTSGTICLFAIEVKARAGSTDIDLSETVIELSDSSTKNILTFSSTNFTNVSEINGNVFTWEFYPHNNNTLFSVMVVEDADESCQWSTPVINSGDHVILTVNVSACFGGLGTNKDVFGKVIPEEGSPGSISFTTPGALSDKVIDLQ